MALQLAYNYSLETLGILAQSLNSFTAIAKIIQTMTRTSSANPEYARFASLAATSETVLYKKIMQAFQSLCGGRNIMASQNVENRWSACCQISVGCNLFTSV